MTPYSVGARSRGRLELPIWPLLWALGAVVTCPSLALGQSVLATVDRSEITIEDQILLKIRVEGATVQPELPPLPDFRVIQRGHETQVSMINGRTESSSLTFNYSLIPKRLGTFEIGPAAIEVDGKRYETRPFKVKVVEASADPLPSRDYYLTARVSNTEPFVGEQVIYTWRFYRRVPVRNASLQLLEFGDLLAEELGEVREYDTTVNGVQYRVSELRRALFAQRPGPASIPPSELTIDVPAQRRRRISVFDLGRGMWETKTLRTRPIELAVKPLPAPPRGFSGLVGDFSIAATLSKDELAVGESSTLSVTISGEGNIQMAAPPTLPALEGFKIYDDKPSSALDHSGTRLRGRKTFRKALVPIAAGEMELPAIRLVYFDPKAEGYRTRTTKKLALDVLPAAGEEELMLTDGVGPTIGKRSVTILANDLLPIRRGIEALAGEAPRRAEAFALAAAFLLPPALYSALLVALRRYRRLARDGALRRRRVAFKRARARLGQLHDGSGPASDPRSFAREASLCLRCYVGDKLGCEGSALTVNEACALLGEAGVDEALLAKVRETLERFEAAQFGVTDRAGVRRSEQIGALDGILRQLDRQLRSAS